MIGARLLEAAKTLVDDRVDPPGLPAAVIDRVVESGSDRLVGAAGGAAGPASAGGVEKGNLLNSPRRPFSDN